MARKDPEEDALRVKCIEFAQVIYNQEETSVEKTIEHAALFLKFINEGKEAQPPRK